MTFAEAGQAPESGVTFLTSATLPAVALMATEPVASGVGSWLMPLAFPP